jgi:predicted dehydrogenase
MSDRVRIGVVGTSWWADAMYLPALAKHPLADVRGIVGGSNLERTREMAARWGIPRAHESLDGLLDSEPLDALLVLTPNRHHFPTTMAALERGLHVLCEKPLGMSALEARRMAEAAERAGVTTMVPFTYRFMPTNRYIKELIEGGYLGRPYHLDMRYYAGYGRSGAYAWRFDLGEAGSGIAGDLGSHWAYLARWFFGEIEAVTAVFSRVVPRRPRPDGAPYEVAEDSAVIVLEFENGASGSLHVSSIAYVPGPFGHLHAMDLHGSGGSLYTTTDWIRTQRLEGCRDGEPETHELPIPDRIFANARRDTVHDTYRDVFREQDNMTRGFVTAIAQGVPASPDFRDGLAVQRVLDAAARSASQGRRVRIEEIVADGG